MNIAELLKMKEGVKGLELECCEVVHVYEPKEHAGKEWQGKQLPAWTSQSVKIKDSTSECYANFKHKVPLTVGLKVKLTGIEINLYKDTKSLNVKGYECLELAKGVAELHQNGKESTPQATVSVKPTPIGLDTPKREISTNTAQNQQVWDSKEKRSIRSVCLSYAKDCFIAGKITETDILTFANRLYNYVYEEEFIKQDTMKESNVTEEIEF